MERVALMLFLMQLFYFIAQEVAAAPLPVKSIVQKEVGKKQSNTLSARGPKSRSSTSRKPGRFDDQTELPSDIDLNTISLEKLIDLKPGSKDVKKKEKDRYLGYFANHPEVRKIDLKHPDMSKVTASLMKLSEEQGARRDRAWKSRMAASIRNHIAKAADLDQARKDALTASLTGQRLRATRRRSNKRWADKVGREHIKELKIASEKRLARTKGYHYDKKSSVLVKKNPSLNLPLEHHLGEGLTALQAEEKAREFDQHYTSQNTLTTKLRDYLKQRKHPRGDITTALGIRAKHLYDLSVTTKKVEKAVAQPSPSPPTVTSTSPRDLHSSPSREISSEHRSGSQVHASTSLFQHSPQNDHRPSLDWQDSFRLDPHQPDWKWLEQILDGSNSSP